MGINSLINKRVIIGLKFNWRFGVDWRNINWRSWGLGGDYASSGIEGRPGTIRISLFIKNLNYVIDGEYGECYWVFRHKIFIPIIFLYRTTPV